MIDLKLLQDTIHIKIESDSYEYLDHLKERFSYYVDGYFFTPQFKAHTWDGRISLIKKNIAPYGLLTDIIKFTKQYYSFEELKIDEKIKDIFNGGNSEYNKDLKLKPWPFQDDIIRKALKYKKGIIRSSTASGKSLMISYVIKTLNERYGGQHIIIVPTKGLVKQFQNDMISYGINSNDISLIYSDEKNKNYDNIYTISTWQSLMNRHELLSRYNTVIIDETHQTSAKELKDILKKSKAEYKLGFTGTLPSNELDLLQVKSYSGPQLVDYSANQLALDGYVAKCTINILNVEYKNNFLGNYNDVKYTVFNNRYRNNLILKVLNKIGNNSVLLLVNFVEKEGKVLRELLSTSYQLSNKRVVFLSGKDEVKIREKWRNECDKKDDVIIIATYGIFSTGINIKSLKYLLFASSTKSEIRTLQSIGRALRMHNDKKNGAYIIDINDNVKYLEEHSIERQRYYKNEQFETHEILLEEGDNIELNHLKI